MRKSTILRCHPARLILPCVAAVWGCLLVAECFSEETRGSAHALIVNAKNQTGGSRDEVKRLFLKQVGNWKSNLSAKPLDRPVKDPAHQVFLANVLGMSEAQFVAHWLTKKQETGATRPLAVSSDRAIGKLVAKYLGAFGFLNMDRGQDPPEGTRVLFWF